MAVDLLDRVFLMPLPGAQWRVLAQYAKHADGTTAEAWPTLATLAAAIGIAPDNVKRHRAALVRAGHLVPAGRRGRAVVYRVTLPELSTLQAAFRKRRSELENILGAVPQDDIGPASDGDDIVTVCTISGQLKGADIIATTDRCRDNIVTSSKTGGDNIDLNAVTISTERGDDIDVYKSRSKSLKEVPKKVRARKARTPPLVGDDALQCNGRRGRRDSTTLAAWLQANGGGTAIADHPTVRKWQADTAVDWDFLRLAWRDFKGYWTTGAGRDKTKTDWPATFRNFVATAGYGLWVCDGSGCRLTTKGEMAKRIMEAEDREHAA
ncbi:helix-turn-helix domain-containing protein [Cupriavidus sp. Agwp_2]|uniref:helix-turn-helix domain-containing protein n=1 Tax=Cupriavidus sp. Agwp_2 TaxID=2897324 RepID=UPI0034602FA0